MAQEIEPPRIYPTFRYRDALKAIDWFTDVIGFKIVMKSMDGDRLGHAELSFGSSIIMIGEDRDDAFGRVVGSPGEQGGKATYVAVEDVDALHERIAASGTTVDERPTDRPYGSREFTCRDPGGNVWCFGTYWPQPG